jgi:hypothetical protein
MPLSLILHEFLYGTSVYEFIMKISLSQGRFLYKMIRLQRLVVAIGGS